MKSATINKLNNLVTLLVANAANCLRSDVQESKKDNLFDVIKYAIRKEANLIRAYWDINASSIAKTPRQLNYVASEVEYKLRRRFLTNPNLKSIWLSFKPEK